MRGQINGLYIRFLVHATEDPEKVEKAIFNLLPSDNIDEIQLKQSPLKGHYGNPITLYETKIKDDKIFIKAKAFDTYGYESDWGSLEITIPRSKYSSNSLIKSFLDRYPRIFLFLNLILNFHF